MNLKNKWMIIPIVTGVLVLGSIALVAGANENISKDNVANQQKDKLTNEEISTKALAVVDGTVTKVEMSKNYVGSFMK